MVGALSSRLHLQPLQPVSRRMRETLKELGRRLVPFPRPREPVSESARVLKVAPRTRPCLLVVRRRVRRRQRVVDYGDRPRGHLERHLLAAVTAVGGQRDREVVRHDSILRPSVSQCAGLSVFGFTPRRLGSAPQSRQKRLLAAITSAGSVGGPWMGGARRATQSRSLPGSWFPRPGRRRTRCVP